jgi:hypothetical protein
MWKWFDWEVTRFANIPGPTAGDEIQAAAFGGRMSETM